MPIFANNADVKKAIFSQQKFDVAIIGSGPAGTMIANELSKKGYKIALIEAGSRFPDTDVGEFFEFSNAKSSEINFGMSWQLGGTSNLWAGRCAPLDAFDLSAAKGWPLSKSELMPYYQRASVLLNLNDWGRVSNVAAFSSSSKNWNSLINSFGWSVTRFQWSKPCFNAGSFLENLIKKYDNLSIFLNTRVLKFNQVDANANVSSVELAIGQEYRCELKARLYVLAAGGIETPRILLNSTDQEQKGLGNRSGALGRYFSTHPKANVGILHLSEPVRLNTPMFVDTKQNDLNLRFGLARKLETSDNPQSLNHYVQFSAKFEKLGANLLEHVRQSKVLNSRKRQRGVPARTLFGGVRSRIQLFAIVAGRVFFNVIGKIGILQRSASIVTLRGFFDQYPNADHSVRLCDATDQYGMRKAQVSWAFSSKDMESVREFLSDLKRDFEKSGIGNLVVTLPDSGRRLTGIHSHFLGTARMGNNPKSSVANLDGRIHDCENLYLAGSSLFPSYGYANPVLTICAVSIRTAEKIDGVLSKGR